ncbi:MAG: hypothetical protein EOO15_24130, partial [Chitinophagaceae bacterium]
MKKYFFVLFLATGIAASAQESNAPVAAAKGISYGTAVPTGVNILSTEKVNYEVKEGQPYTGVVEGKVKEV